MYGTLARLRAEHLSQVPAGDSYDALLTQALTTATALIERALGFAFAGYASTASARAFWHEAADHWLYLPYHESGSLTTLALDGAEIDSDSYAAEADDHTALFNDDGWAAGRYTATAKWGYGPAPEDIIKITMQLAVDQWNGRNVRSSSESAGLDGPGQASLQRAFTWQQWQTLQLVRRAYGHMGVA